MPGSKPWLFAGFFLADFGFGGRFWRFSRRFRGGGFGLAGFLCGRFRFSLGCRRFFGYWSFFSRRSIRFSLGSRSFFR